MLKTFVTPLVPLIVPNVLHILESDRAKDYFVRTRKEKRGWDVLEMYPKTEEAESMQWSEVIRGLDELVAWMDQRKDELLGSQGKRSSSPWIFGGEGPTWADIALVSAFLWVEKGGKEGAWDKIKSLHDGRWGLLYDGLKPYMQVL